MLIRILGPRAFALRLLDALRLESRILSDFTGCLDLEVHASNATSADRVTSLLTEGLGSLDLASVVVSQPSSPRT
jgi:hypothetical protein